MAGRDADCDPGRDLLPDRPAPDRLRADRGGGARMNVELERLAAALHLPELPGTRGAGLDPAADRGRARRDLPLLATTSRDREQLAALTASLRAGRGDLLIGIDEEGGDVTRLETDRGSSYPGQRRARRRRRRRADRAGRGGDRRRPARGRGQPRLRAGGRRQRQPDEPGDRHPLVRRRPGARRAARRGVRRRPAARRASRRAPSTSPATARPSRTRTSSCPVVVGDVRDGLPPFRAAIEAGVQTIMTAHVRVPALDDAPATLSPAVVQRAAPRRARLRRRS